MRRNRKRFALFRHSVVLPSAVLVISITAAAIGGAVIQAAEQEPVHRGSEMKRPRGVQVSRHMPVTRAIDTPRPAVPDFVPREKGYDILIDKSERRMDMFVSGRHYRSYTIYLGFTPDGDKTRRGDGRTPEGTYYVCRRNEASAYYRSLLVSYPSPDDARRGVESGLVGPSILEAVRSAYARGAAPPQNTRLGGNICIHGEGGRQRPQRDWTAGCVAVTNEEMAEIFSLIPLGTPVTIRP